MKPFWFDPSYGIGLCNSCHSDHAHGSEVEAQIDFRDFAKEWLAKKGLNYDKMRLIARAPSGGLKEWELLEIEKRLKQQLKELV